MRPVRGAGVSKVAGAEITTPVAITPGTDTEIEDWQSLSPYLSNGTNDPGQDDNTGWYSESLGDPTLGDPDDPSHLHYARYYRDRGRVYLGGAVRYWPGTGNAEITLPVPAALSPERPTYFPLWTSTTIGDVGSLGLVDPDELWWLWFPEDILTALPHYNHLGSPEFGAPPDFTLFILDGLSYRHA